MKPEAPTPLKKPLEAAAIVLFILPFFNGLYNRALRSHPALFWIVDVLQFIVVPGVVAYLLFAKAGLKAGDVGLEIPRNAAERKKFLVHVAAASAIFYFFTNALFALSDKYFPSAKYVPVFDYGWMMPSAGIGKPLVSFYYGISAGFVEEFYYRGILVALFSIYGMSGPVIVTVVSAMFSLIHWEAGPGHILAIFILSVAITSYYVRYRMLWPLIAAHFVFDWIWFFKT